MMIKVVAIIAVVLVASTLAKGPGGGGPGGGGKGGKGPRGGGGGGGGGQGGQGGQGGGQGGQGGQGGGQGGQEGGQGGQGGGQGGQGADPSELLEDVFDLIDSLEVAHLSGVEEFSLRDLQVHQVYHFCPFLDCIQPTYDELQDPEAMEELFEFVKDSFGVVYDVLDTESWEDFSEEKWDDLKEFTKAALEVAVHRQCIDGRILAHIKCHLDNAQNPEEAQECE